MRLRFVHPPRTGGSSIVRAWGPKRGKSGEYHGHRLPGPRADGEWRYGFTRNPWDRVVSLYYLANPHATLDEKAFQRWVLGGMDGSARFGHRWETQVSLPTIAWLRDADFVGRFETRDEDLGQLAVILWRPVPDEHIAASPRRKDYHEYYDESSKAYVAGRYKDDIEEFGYAFS